MRCCRARRSRRPSLRLSAAALRTSASLPRSTLPPLRDLPERRFLFEVSGLDMHLAFRTLPACFGLSAALVIAATLGCQASATVPSAAKSSAALSPAEINLVIGDGKALEAKIAEHKGQVVFVDFWATWCLPCVEGFPHTVSLAKEYKKQGLATIAVSFDQIDDEPKVREFLAKQGADFEHL